MNSELSPFVISASHPVPLLVLAIIGAVAFSIWTYRRTNPPVSLLLKATLTTLRSLGLIGGIWLIFQPSLQINRSETSLLDLFVLIDRSASMDLNYKDFNIKKGLEELFDSEQFKRLSSRTKISAFSFSDSLRLLSDFSSYRDSSSGPETAIGNALSEMITKFESVTPELILLVSDGANNSGIDPARIARISKIPISTIGVGAITKSLDLMITDVAVNPIVYQGSKVPVEVFYRGVGAKDLQFGVNLIDPLGKSIGRQTIQIPDNFSEGKAVFEIPLDSAGRFMYRVEIPRIDGELTYDNNSRSVVINSLANRLRILVMSGSPDYGLGDLIHRLSANQHIEIIQRTERGGGFYEGEWPNIDLLSKTDVVILHHFPTSKTQSAKLRDFSSFIIGSNLPVCLIDGGDLDPQGAQLFADVLPISIEKSETFRTGKISPVSRHAILSPPDETDFAQRWNELPPLSCRIGMSKLRPNSELLAEFKFENGTRSPALIISETAGRKSAVILARDLWKWGMVSPGENGVIEPVLDRLVKWLALRRMDKHVQLSFSKNQFSTRDIVSFRVSCFDESFQPYNGADVEAEIRYTTGEPIRINLTGDGNGQYKGGFVPWMEGVYKVKVTASAGEKILGVDSGDAVVDAYSIELLDAYLNQPLLQAIADGSGGKYIPLDSAGFYFDSLNLPRQVSDIHKNIELWGGWLHLALVILALSVEWFIRVRLGML